MVSSWGIDVRRLLQQHETALPDQPPHQRRLSPHRAHTPDADAIPAVVHGAAGHVLFGAAALRLPACELVAEFVS